MIDLKYLDNYQKAAVYSNSRNTLIVAAPGSGKTTVIINRAVYLIEHKAINPKNIIIITFTKNAAINMKKRYYDITKDSNIPFFGTFHSLFYNILSKYYGKIDIISENEIYKIINSVLIRYMDNLNEEKVKKVINYISLIKTGNLKIESDEFEIDKSILRQCINTYERYKKENKLLDFDDLQMNTKNLFIENTNILDYYRKRFNYILVDEFQDCDINQIQILKLLNYHNSIFAVGDEDQCIYTFRGSKPECMVNFNNYFEEGKKYFLSINYRCPHNIVEISKKLIEKNINRNLKIIKSSKDIMSKVTLINSESEFKQAIEINKYIDKLTAKGKYKLSDITILFRTNIESRVLIDTFLKNKIAFKLLDKEYNFYNHFICKDILAYLRLSIDSSDIGSFVRVINKPFRYISKINIEKVRKNKFKECCFETLENINELPLFQIKNIKKLKRNISYLNRISLQESIDYILNKLEYKDYIEGYCIKYKIEKDEFDEIFDELKESLYGFEDINTFLNHVDKVQNELKNIKKDKEGVILSTIHGAKGMEFKNVFIINCVEENIPHISNVENNLDEERRLFYVGITRTIDNLWLCYPNTIRGKCKLKSRFLKECGLIKKEEGCLLRGGEKVFHESFGEGIITSVEGENVSIKFKNNIERWFNLTVSLSNKLIKVNSM